MEKMITVVEFPHFLDQVGKCIEPEERDKLIDYVATNPEEGDEIPGSVMQICEEVKNAKKTKYW